jgi:putative MATE family efflux protein
MPICTEQTADPVCAGFGPRVASTEIPAEESNSVPIAVDDAILTTGSVGRHLLRLAVPMASGMLAVIVLYLMDAFFIARLGTESLAAISLAFPVIMAVGSIAVGLGVGASAVLAQAVGRGDRRQIRRLTTDCLLLSIMIVGFFIVLGLATLDPLFRFLGADDKTLPLVGGYMRIWYPGMIFLVVPMIGNNALRASGEAFWPATLTILSAGFNILLDPILIFGMAGLEPMGIAGAAVAATIARAASLLGSLWILHFRKGMLDLAFPPLAEVLDSWRRILRIGLPAMGAAMIIPASSAILTAMMARFGSPAVAAFGVATRIESFAMVALYALSASLIPFLGQNLGAGHTHRMTRALRLAFAGCSVWGLLVAAVLAVAARPITGLFDPHPLVVERAALYLRLVPISFALQGFALVAASAFNALGRPMSAAALTALRTMGLTIPLAWFGCQWFGPQGAFAAIGLTNAIAGVASLMWIRRWNGIPSKVTIE